MPPIERDPIDRFDAELDALARGEPWIEPSDPALLASVRRLRSLDAARGPDPGVADRIWDELMRQTGQASAAPLPASLSIARTALNGHAAPQPWRVEAAMRPPVTRPRWTTSHLATAALIVLLLTASVIAGRFTALPDRQAMVVEAPHAPAVETFLDTTIEGAADVWTPMSIERWTFQPGASTLTIPPLDGPQWIIAERGALIATAAGAKRNLAVGHGMAIDPGQELVLGNAGQGDAAALRGVAASGFSLEEYDRRVIAMQVALDTEAHEALPPGTSRVIFERLTLEPEATLVTRPEAGQDLLAVESGRLGLTLVGDGLPGGWRSGRERELGPKELVPALVPGTKVSLRNVGDDPLILLRLRVLPLTD
jgi:hypothetical protein